MKKVILIVIASILVVALIALLLVKMNRDKKERAMVAAATEEPVVTATPEPTAVPVPPQVVLVLSDADEAFRTAVRQNDSCEYSECDIDKIPELENLKAVFVFLDKKDNADSLQTALNTGVPVIVYNRCGAELPEGVVSIDNAKTGLETAKDAMEAAIVYPPHDTPVRLFGVFTTENSEAAKVWEDYIAQGKVLSKGAYFGDDSEEFSAWFENKMESYWPGMVDAVYCEDPEYAVSIVKEMALYTRDDFEVFTIGTEVELVELAQQYPRVLPMIANHDDAAAAAAAKDLIDTAVNGGKPESIILSD